jgi:hypothetical protein
MKFIVIAAIVIISAASIGIGASAVFNIMSEPTQPDEAPSSARGVQVVLVNPIQKATPQTGDKIDTMGDPNIPVTSMAPTLPAIYTGKRIPTVYTEKRIAPEADESEPVYIEPQTAEQIGYTWAANNGITDARQCPHDSPGVERGCYDFVLRNQ